ncbi:hypothetical protein H4J50_13580 [Colwellia sp. 6M3]|jgi:hypothetical protein|uniref:hypothetical protein n=1 Tax=Colwellia sp. 6M3 TaxID=2759849 RepID=UPI0015F364E7|nr:hypothetical protein [Colwellia sp. 6M3]MBA6417049.1 hypothetical protein [Colwellia sp. 6M3]|tara:strand:+ start:206 stop:487 length:282 start_codon:yes stop_codon:yes gene_type:complete
MNSLESIKSKVIEHPYTSSSKVLIQAAASACSEDYGVNLCQASYKLDRDNKRLLWELMNITLQPDFSNKAQYEMLVWLEKEGFLECATKYKKS